MAEHCDDFTFPDNVIMKGILFKYLQSGFIISESKNNSTLESITAIEQINNKSI